MHGTAGSAEAPGVKPASKAICHPWCIEILEHQYLGGLSIVTERQTVHKTNLIRGSHRRHRSVRKHLERHKVH